MTTSSMKVGRTKVWQSLAGQRETGIVIVILLVGLGISLRTPYFLTGENVGDIFVNISIQTIVAIGQMMVILTGGIDISVASVIGLTAMAVGMVMRDYPSLPPLLSIPLGILIGFVLGMINGLLVSKGKVPPIITTLSTMGIYRGVILILSKGRWVNTYEMPQNFVDMTKNTFLGIPFLIWCAIIIAVLAYYFLEHTRRGRAIYAVGGNRLGAEFAGIRTTRVDMLVYTLSGCLAGLAGTLWVSRQAAAWNDTALGFELQTVAACVLGGVSILGGTGTVVGVLLGSLLLGIVTNSLLLINISPYWQTAVYGAIILIAVVIDAVISGRLQRALLLRRGK